MTHYQVGSGNDYFSVVDGVLFNKDKTTLIAYPPAKSGTTYSIPISVDTLGMQSFYNSTLLKLIIPSSVTTIPWAILDYMDIYYGDLMILGIPGTRAEEFADDREIPFLPLGLVVETPPTKDLYNIGEAFSSAGMVVRLYNEDGTSQVVTGYSVTGYNSAQKGAQTLTITYQDKAVALTVWVGLVLVPSPYPESAHPYADDFDYTWTFQKAGALSLTIIFSNDTETEGYYDKIYLYKGDGTLVGTYSGKELAGKAITIPGNSFRIRLETDGSVTKYGFRIIRILAEMNTTIITATIPGSGDFVDPFIIEYPPEAQLDGVQLNIDEYDDEKKYEILGFDPATPIFDINLTKNGQPVPMPLSAKVIVRIPDPFLDDVTPQIYRVSDDGKTRTLMETKRVIYNGLRYLEFETDHFSLYALVAVASAVKISAPATTVGYNGSIQLTASGGNGTYTWSIDSEKYVKLDKKTGTTVSASSIKNFWKLGSATITVKDSNGMQSASFTLKVKPSFWQWIMIIALFGWIWM